MAGPSPEDIRRRFAEAVAGDDADTALEVVKEVYGAASRGDWGAARGLFDSEIAWEPPSGGPTAGLYKGPQEAIEEVGTWTEPFEGFDWRPERLAVNGDRVLVSGRMSGQGRGSGVPVAAEEFHVLTLRDARIVRLQMFLDEGEARTAAGLPE
jgi:ketosteroid isomerase-like protein